MSDAVQPVTDDRLLETLERLLTIQSPRLRPSLDQASTLVGDALQTEKVDIFLYEDATHSLVAIGTSQTPLGTRQRALGLHRMPIANNGPAVTVFQTGEPYRSGAVERDPAQPRGLFEHLGVRSQMDVIIEVDGQRRGVLGAASTSPDHFTERDLIFFQAVAGWIGMLTHRAELFEQQTHLAVQQGRTQAGDEIARLTPRQRDIAMCVAAGLTNEQIAERLVIATGTVNNHISAILERLDLSNRAQLAVWAVELGLYRSSHRQAMEPESDPV